MSLASSNLVWLIPGLPLLGFFFHALFGKRAGKKAVAFVATAVVFASFAISLYVCAELLRLPAEGRRSIVSLIPGAQNVPWISIGSFQSYYRALIDPLALLMCLIVTGVGGLIHLYATGYMGADRDHPRFFTYLNLFIFFMLILVMADNILLMFVGWEGVGLCSYLLISFWYEDVENSKAGNKAFIVNRIGDVGFGLGVMAIFSIFGTLVFYTPDRAGFLDMAARGTTAAGPFTIGAATLIGLLLFFGATGKSAQIPLYVWLPDAMAGPTPVSALIHAATMVTAGVVMVARVGPLIIHSTVTMAVIAFVGIATAIFAASIALTQNDIKKVLAYSTVSQLGYMFVACGVGAFAAGLFHVTTHAFFKAVLFLGAGSVIHALGGEQDMRKMGGLAKRIPITHWTMVMGWLAICGIWGFSGFWSKDEILGAASGQPGFGMILYVIGIITAFMTAFYMTRLMAKTFWTSQRFSEAELAAHGHGGHGDAESLEAESHALAESADTTGADHLSAAHPPGQTENSHEHGNGVHESPPSMLIPLVILGALSVIGGFINTPWNPALHQFLEPSLAATEAHHGIPVMVGLVLGGLVGALGALLAYRLYMQRKETAELLTPEQKATNPWYQGSLHLWYVDSAFYRIFVVEGGRVANITWRWIDQGLVDGLVRFLAYFTGFWSEVFRRFQTGYVRNYALMMLVGVVAVVGGILWGARSLLVK